MRFELSPQGLFEYAFFVIEMWSLRANLYATEWIDSVPILTRKRFEETVAGAEKVSDLRPPEHFGPLARVTSDGGGRVRFLVHTTYGWERIYYLESLVFPDKFVEQEAGEIVADMGSAQIF